MDWTTWLQGIGTNVAQGWTNREYNLNPQLQLAQLNAMNQYGQAYNEGQAAAARTTINPTILLLVAGVVVVLMVKGD